MMRFVVALAVAAGAAPGFLKRQVGSADSLWDGVAPEGVFSRETQPPIVWMNVHADSRLSTTSFLASTPALSVRRRSPFLGGVRVRENVEPYRASFLEHGAQVPADIHLKLVADTKLDHGLLTDALKAAQRAEELMISSFQ